MKFAALITLIIVSTASLLTSTGAQTCNGLKKRACKSTTGCAFDKASKACSNADRTSTSLPDTRLAGYGSTSWPMQSWKQRAHAPNTPRLFNLGMSKSGSTSLSSYFTCHNLNGFHYKKCLPVTGSGAHPPHACAFCVINALERNVTIESTCGEFDYFAEFNYKSTLNNGTFQCLFPTFTHLDAIDAMYPGSKYFMPMRNVSKWLDSAKHWGNMVSRFDRCLTDMHIPELGQNKYERVAGMYLLHAKRVRDYFKARPGQLLEYDIEDPNAEHLLNSFLGYGPLVPDVNNKTCWGSLANHHAYKHADHNLVPADYHLPGK